MIRKTRKDSTIILIKNHIKNNDFINNHKENIKDFTRNRILTFAIMFVLILQKSVKSIQLVLNELFMKDYINNTTSASAYSQARKKFKHTAFLELNAKVVNNYYQDDNIKLWNGYRILGVDSSKIILPNTEEMQEEFGLVKIKNQHIEDTYTCAMFECCYDVLNHIAVKSSLNHGSSYEADLATTFLTQNEQTLKCKDIEIYDRGYASYEFLANLIFRNKDYVIRCPINSFKSSTNILINDIKNWSAIATLKVSTDKRKTPKNKELPTEITVRFISIILDTGEIEILMTSIMDSSITRDEFKKLYFLRWGVEGFFNLLKGRLNLENFTGKSVESVKQDFWSTIFLTNLETIFTEDVADSLNQQLKETQLPKKINKAVSLNAIKNMAFAIFFDDLDTAKTKEKLTKLFVTNTILNRVERSPPRKKISTRRSYNYQKRNRKHVY